MGHVAELAMRRGQQSYLPGSNASHHKQAFHHSRSSLGATGHWVHLLSVAAPLVIGEMIKDPEKRWRYLRLASVGAAIASEAVWTLRLSKDKKKDEEMHDALRACSEQLR
jgi:hypothetical protein